MRSPHPSQVHVSLALSTHSLSAHTGTLSHTYSPWQKYTASSVSLAEGYTRAGCRPAGAGGLALWPRERTLFMCTDEEAKSRSSCRLSVRNGEEEQGGGGEMKLMVMER